jgi:serine/threonine protein kinase/tetratricopeptide (TPR) repeat protein
LTETADRTVSAFAAAVVLRPAERAAFLDRECADDTALRGRIEALLRAHDRAGHRLDLPVPGDLEQTTAYIPGDPPGAVIAGRYKLLEEIGEGGMGTVWLAEQTSPVKRKVALKLIKAGMDSKSVLARFDAERQALAVMDHPHIAKVFDGGVSEQGRPFFVMEYVKGVPLTEYCDKARLTLQERLKLFVPVCQAVQHAHQKGILHRDLKPSNILVCLFDGKPVPKVIDFGLAKAMHQPLTELTLHTAHGVMVGTPLYMSPEQAEFNNLDIDTRADVYSLGVILYELLTGTTPLEKQQLKAAALNEVLRLIKEVEPPKPSTRLSGSTRLPSIAAQRGLEPAQLCRSIQGDLDWIVMKALEKERSRRYETANGLARDVERFLNDEVVEASPPNTIYRVRKFIHKHRAAITMVTAIALLLLVATAISTWQAIRATRAEASVSAEQRRTAEQSRIAIENYHVAREQSINIIRLIESSEPEFAMVPALHDRRAELLKTASEACRQFLTQDPDNLELVQQAAQIYRFAANFNRLTNQTEQAEVYYKNAIDLDKRLVKEFPTKVAFQLNLSDVFRDYANLLVIVGRLRQAAENLSEAEAIAEDLLRSNNDDPVFRRSLALALLNKSRVEYRQGKHLASENTAKTLERSTSMFRDLVNGSPERRHPYEPLLLATALNLTGIVKREIGKLDEAEKIHAEAAALLKDLQDNKPPMVNEADIIHFRAECQIEQAKTWAKINKPKYLTSAEANMGLAINRLLQLARDYPRIPTYQESVAKAFRERGEVRVQAENFQGAREHFQSALDLLVSLSNKYDSLPELRAELGKSYAGLGKAAFALQDGKSAQFYKTAISEIRKASARSPDDARFKQWLAELADVHVSE